VTDQNRIVNVESVEQLRQHTQRFVVHEPDTRGNGRRGRSAVPRAAVDECGASRAPRQHVGDIAPRGDTAEAFVEEDEGTGRYAGSRDESMFEHHALE
jgi:hypothetical protein